jgi:hypothetical protein
LADIRDFFFAAGEGLAAEVVVSVCEVACGFGAEYAPVAASCADGVYCAAIIAPLEPPLAAAGFVAPLPVAAEVAFGIP